MAAAFALNLQGQPVDLFLLAGQSNMAGRGVPSEADKAPIEGVFVFGREGAWKPAVDPLHWDRPAVIGVGLGRSFARTLLAMGATRSVGLIPAAFGGSSLAEWQPGSAHFRNAVDRARQALRAAGPQARLRGVLWHQGEADSSSPENAATYRYRFGVFLDQLRAELNAPALPVVVGQLGRFIAERPGAPSPYARAVDEELALLPLTLPAVGFVSSEGLRDKGDALHFDTPSLYEFGRRYALAWLALSPVSLKLERQP